MDKIVEIQGIAMPAPAQNSQPIHEIVEAALTNVHNQVPGAAAKLLELQKQGIKADADQEARFMNKAWVDFQNHKAGSGATLMSLVNAGIEVPADRAAFGLKKEIDVLLTGGYKDQDLSKTRLTLLAGIGIGPNLPEFDVAMRSALREIREKQPAAQANYDFLKSLGGKISPAVGEYAMKNALRDLRDGEPGAKEHLTFLQKEGAVAPPEVVSHYLLLAAKDYANADKPDPTTMKTLKDMGGKLGPNESSKIARIAANEAMNSEPDGLKKLETLYSMDIKLERPAEQQFINRIMTHIKDGVKDSISLFNNFMDIGIKPDAESAKRLLVD